MTYANEAVLISMLLAALYTDFRWCKIYNKLTIPCMAAGLCLNTLQSGIGGLLQSLGGAGLVLLLFLLLAPITGIGGGDTKLMIAVGAIMGINFTVTALLYTAITGGVMALAVMLRHRILASSTRRMAVNVYMKAFLGVPVGIAEGSSGVKFRYAPAIFIGCMAALAVAKCTLP